MPIRALLNRYEERERETERERERTYSIIDS